MFKHQLARPYVPRISVYISLFLFFNIILFRLCTVATTCLTTIVCVFYKRGDTGSNRRQRNIRGSDFAEFSSTFRLLVFGKGFIILLKKRGTVLRL